MSRRRKPRVREPLAPLPFLARALVLVLSTWGLLFTHISVFSLDVNRPVVLAGCILCPLAFLAIFSLPRLRWLPLLGSAGAWGGILWHFQDVLALGEISMRCSVVNTFARYLDGVTPIHPLADLPAETWTHAATLLALVALVPYCALTAWALAGRRAPWLFFGLSFPFLLPALSLTVLPDLPPLLALLAAWIAVLLPARTEGRNRAGGARLTLGLLPLSVALLTLLVLLLPPGEYQRPRWADVARVRLITWATDTFEGVIEGENGPFGGGSTTLAEADGSVNLSDAGPLSFSGRTVLRVNAPDLEGRIYLRAFSGTTYRDGSWAPLDPADYASLHWEEPTLEDLASSVYTPSLDGYQPMNFPALANRTGGGSYTPVTVENVGADPGYVYYPYQLLTRPEELSGAQFHYDDWLSPAEGVDTHTLYIMPGCDPLEAPALEGDAAYAEQSYRYFVEKYYLQVPGDLQYVLPGYLVTLSMEPEKYLPGGTSNEHYQALMGGRCSSQAEAWLETAYLVADYLTYNAEYDPNAAAPPEGEDPVVYFLNVSRRGYCMHFASAAALLLRSAGIPARYVTGYVADLKSGRASVPDSNAHAWVEVYLPGYGWEPVEVTPAYAGSTPGQSGVAEPSPTPSATPTPSAAPEESAQPTPTPTPDEESPDSGEERPLPAWLVWFAPGGLALLAAVQWMGPWIWLPVGLLAALAALILRRRLAAWRRQAAFRQENPNLGVIRAYRYVLRLTRWGAELDPALEALAQKAKFSPHTLTEEERASALSAARTAAGQLDGALPLPRRLLLRYLLALL